MVLVNRVIVISHLLEVFLLFQILHRQVAVVEGCSLDAPGGLFAAWDELSAQARAQLGPDNAMLSSPLVCHSPHPSLRRVLQTEARWTEAPTPHAGEGASDAG